jgi:hypothetical protein
MAITVYPSGGVTDNWIAIANSTPTSGSTVSFTSISTAYRKLWVTTETSMTLDTAGFLYIQANTITSGNSYISFAQTGTTARKNDDLGIYNYVLTSAVDGYLNYYITNKNSSIPYATFTGQGSAGNNGTLTEFGYIPTLTSAITQIDVVTNSTYAAGNTGKIVLYGTY